jgi:site-specific DNA-methyltransferase (adenine-specific)
MVMWLYGSGFPKSKSCLKPAHEPIVLAKAPGPLQSLGIDACRVGTAADMNPRDFDDSRRTAPKFSGILNRGKEGQYRARTGAVPAGRYPPNLVLSHHPACRPAACVVGCPVKALDEQAGPRTSGAFRGTVQQARRNQSKGAEAQRVRDDRAADTGSASRFFPTFSGAPDPEDAPGVPFRYVPKASRSERDRGCAGLPAQTNDWQRASSGLSQGKNPQTGERSGVTMGPRTNHHPTVKPLALMQWLCRLITPPGGLVLDPFCGSGSTLVACVREQMHFIGIDASAEYCEIARRRIAHEQEQQTGPLFAGLAS